MVIMTLHSFYKCFWKKKKKNTRHADHPVRERKRVP